MLPLNSSTVSSVTSPVRLSKTAQSDEDAAAQAALKAQGLYRGEEDGQFSPQVRDALLAFQRKSDLYQTGVPDPATLWTLLNP